MTGKEEITGLTPDEVIDERIAQDVERGRWPFPTITEEQMRLDIAEANKNLDLENKKQQLTKVGQKLANAGYSVHWETQSELPALVVNSLCLIRVSFDSENVFSGSFWHSINRRLQEQLKQTLGDQIEFNPFPFQIGGPNLGEKITPTTFVGKILHAFNG